MKSIADTILHNGKIATLNDKYSFAKAVAIKEGRFLNVGTNEEVLGCKGPKTQLINLGGRTVIPGLNDSHMHIIRGGLNYNMELRWDGVTSLADALNMLREQGRRTPPPQWVRVVGGWTEFQFKERRMPTLDEINAVAPETPVFILHLYDRAFLNQAALRAIGYTKDTPTPPSAEIQRDNKGNPTGLLIAKPNALILYSALAKGPKLSYEDQVISTRHFMRELNRLGVTSAIDAGGGFQNYPEDYAVINSLAKEGKLTVRIAYNLFTQRPKQELDDFSKWIKETKPGKGDDYLHVNGAGEMLVFSAADFEDFLEPRPELIPTMEYELKEVIKLLATNRWPFRIHATYNESITRFLNVFEEINRDIPFNGLRWFFDHAETISEKNIERVRALGGGIAIQDRMAFQGEYFINRYGKEMAGQAPPITKLIRMGVPIGAGTDATRVASFNPWVSLYWLTTGKTVGGTPLYQRENLQSRMDALRHYTIGSAWFSGDENKKGSIETGKFADLAVLSDDYFEVPDEHIKRIESVLTIVDGKSVFASGEFEKFSPPTLPVSPSWSPIGVYGGYHSGIESHEISQDKLVHAHKQVLGDSGLWVMGCDCFAF
jgi:predicted amidohydrolase YtcJ